jgi:hypothetical protein
MSQPRKSILPSLRSIKYAPCKKVISYQFSNRILSTIVAFVFFLVWTRALKAQTDDNLDGVMAEWRLV